MVGISLELDIPSKATIRRGFYRLLRWS